MRVVEKTKIKVFAIESYELLDFFQDFSNLGYLKVDICIFME